MVKGCSRSDGDSPPQWHDGTACRRHHIVRKLAFALVALASISWLSVGLPSFLEEGRGFAHGATDVEKQSAFTWGQIKPSSEIQYHDCFDGLQCARLEVPMDYRRTDGKGRKFAIAVVRLPAKVPVTDPRYGGAILINPGGPGGSGVAQLLVSGRNLQLIADSEEDPRSGYDEASADLPRYFDVIGFDPRGVNNTTPAFTCFPSTFARKNWELQVEADGMLGSSDSSFMRNWQRSKALNDGCSEVISTSVDGDEAIGEHVNTSPVARDMIEIIERHAQWREKQGKAAQKAYDLRNGRDESQSIAARTRWNKGKEKLLYWGRSYGTVLGSTFAAVYPDRVARVVLDGVVDLDYYYLTNGPSNLVDADAIFDRFTLYCDTAGPDGCPFYTPGGPHAIKHAYSDLLSRIWNESVPVPASPTRGPEVITWTDVKVVTRIAMYQPLLTFPLFARLLADLKQGNGSAFADFKQQSRRPSCPSDECLLAGPFSRACTVPGENDEYATSAILCTDAERLGDVDQEGFKAYWDGLKAGSETLGDYWAHVRLGCVGWKAKAKWRFTGPFGGNTSHPLLFIGNTLDPVTPLRNARKMSQNFPGSAVLQQDSEGHTTLTAPSLCVAKAIRHYFQGGDLPARDTVCQADLKPLIGAPPSSAIHAEALSPRDRALRAALDEEVRNFRSSRTALPL
ncbi:hypothetical protein VTN02DRAFT_5207 [Thermoascus thermophilus]